MERETVIRERFKVFKALTGYGYNTDTKIIKMDTDELVMKNGLNRSEIAIAIGIKNSLKNAKLVTYLNGLEGIVEENKKQNISK